MISQQKQEKMKRRIFNELSQFCFTCVDKNEGWFVGDKYTVILILILLIVVLKNSKIAEEELIQKRRYWKLIKVHNKIILIPCKHNKIGILNTKNNNFRHIYLTSDLSEYSNYIVHKRIDIFNQ